ncbi:hypothetical protein JNW88_29910, partial [Micromonospora sp. ATA32]|nr:hypothetical protein [Micromonospora sp. ATA32]
MFENTRSPSTYLNRTIAGDATLPPEADPAAAPSTPARPGLTVRAVEAGARLELVNRTGRNVEVIG